MSKYLDATPEERNAWIEEYIQRRKAEGYDIRLHRYGRHHKDTSTMSVHSSLRHKAVVAWNKRVKRAKERVHAEEGLQEGTTEVPRTVKT